VSRNARATLGHNGDCMQRAYVWIAL